MSKDKFTLIRQSDKKDCGVTCIQMILNHYDSSVPIHKLRDMTSTDKDGVSALGISNCFQSLNFESTVIKADSSVWSYDELVFPLIANTVTDEGELHYVVIYGKKGDFLLIADPDKGKYKKSINNFYEIWTGVLILAEAGQNYKPRHEKIGGILSFFPILLKSKWLVIKAVLLSFVVTFLSILGSYYFQGVIDFVIPQYRLDLINVLSIALILGYIIRTLIDLLKNLIIVNFGLKINLEIMSNYFQHIMKLPMKFFSSRQTGDIISRFLDGSRIIDALISAPISIIIDTTMFVIVGIVLFLQNITLFFFVVFSLPIYIITILVFTKKFEIANEQQMQKSSILNSSIIESLRGIETIKSYRGEEKVILNINELFNNMLNKVRRVSELDNYQLAIKVLTELITSAFVIWLGFFYVLNNGMSLGELITFNSLLTFFTTPIQNIVNLQVKLQTAETASKRLNEVLLIETERKHEGQIKLEKIEQKIEIENLNFSYNLKQNTLKNINLSINVGEKVAIVGMSGSGKSTLAKLLVKFYECHSGAIFCDKYNIKDISTDSLRKIITYVPQEPYLFSGTIYENITFGKDRSVSIDELQLACKIAHIDEFIENSIHGFDTKIEESGHNLSGGQIQRLSLARAIVSDSQVLIFDEISAGIDSVQETKIINSLFNMENKTMVFITHSLNVSKRCDRIFVMESGKIVESGTYCDLMNFDSSYKKMWEKIY